MNFDLLGGLMGKISIKVYLYGPLPFSIDISKLKKWRSSLFEIFEVLSINNKERVYAKDTSKEIKDIDIKGQTIELVKNKFEFITHDKLVDINLIVGYIDLADNWFLYSLKDDNMANTIILSYRNIYDELIQNNIPLENLILSSLYTYSLIFLKNNSLPTKEEERSIMHFDTRGCLFDLTNEVTDVKFYTNYPIICNHCQQEILNEKINVKKLNRELKTIRKSFFYRLYENIKNNILLYILLTSCFSTFLTKITSVDTYSKKAELILSVIFGSLSLLLLYVWISSLVKKHKRYSQNINSHNTK